MEGILQLPREILTEILTRLTKEELKHLSHSSKKIRAIAQPLLLARVKVIVPTDETKVDLRNITSSLRCLAQVPHPASYIRSLTIIRWNHRVRRRLKGLSALLDSTVQLRSLYLQFVYVDDNLAMSLIKRTQRPGFWLKFVRCVFATSLTLTSTPIHLETLLLEDCFGSPSFPLTLLENGREAIKAYAFEMASRRIEKEYREMEFPGEHLILPGLRSLSVESIPTAFLASHPWIEKLWVRPMSVSPEDPSWFDGLSLSILPNVRIFHGYLADAKVFIPGRPIEHAYFEEDGCYSPQQFQGWWDNVIHVISKSTGPLLSFVCIANFSTAAIRRMATLCPSLRSLFVQLDPISNSREISLDDIDAVVDLDVLLEHLSNFKNLRTLMIEKAAPLLFTTVKEFMNYLASIKQKAPTVTTIKWWTRTPEGFNIVYCGRWEEDFESTPARWSVWSKDPPQVKDDWFPEADWRS